MREAMGVLTVLLLLAQLPGCIMPGIVRSSSNVSAPTVGRQLIDLKEALDSGAITQEEYQRKRESIIRSETQ